MLPEELRALRRIGLTQHGEEITRKNALIESKVEAMFGFADDKTNKLVDIGRTEMELAIAERILTRSSNEVLNNCPNCGALARTPRAKQCRFCGNDWHNH